jgi:thiol-disulfide isomerase/thioredoxin
MLGYACHGHSSQAEPENLVPSPSALGRASGVPNVRSITGKELSHLARAWGNSGTLINVWASWCGSCKGELPMLHQIANEYASRGLHVVVVSVDEPEDHPRLAAIISGFGFSPPVWVAARPLSKFKSTLAQNWMGNIPVTFLYDFHGKRRFFWDGPIDAEELRPIVERFLSGEDIQGEQHFDLAPGITNGH